jgi:hypothetical protein
MHLNHASQSEAPAQHVCSHMPVPISMSVQLCTQARAPAHVESFRQFCVSSQQSATMHWLHGVPPGSSVHVPASIGTPQCPLSQVRPTQHCWSTWQFDPGGRQVSAPQTSLWQTMEQQSLATMHGKPSMVQVFASQVPEVQMPLQQSLGRVQLKPSDAHCPIPQVPRLVSQSLAQQSVSTAHGSPSGEHAEGPQTSVCWLQSSAQQSVSTLHGKPSGLHVVSPQVLVCVSHVPPQHCASDSQSNPSGTHWAHIPALGSHASEQQSVLAVQESPRERQLSQTPSLLPQRLEQH